MHTRRLFALSGIIAASFLIVTACGTSSTSPDASAPAGTASAPVGAAPADASVGDAAADAGDDASADAGEDAALPGTSEGCPADMLLVAGDYCPSVNQVCLEHHDEYNKDEAKKKSKREAGEDVA